ncbi:hypothetical protein CesoFtcFv8_022817 [Champsocephalus esox]|uniref:Zona pellucida protein C n=1 Tax=Champsocephalus esox TaxID=159716 RepID=A0AAN8GHT6_9TELE|nr:hypothetical protein CesoFtcFv8_022817 [Champsocephalus esox]
MALKERPMLLFLFPVTIREDWTGETLTSVFYTGDLLHLEASYSGPDAGHRRLFIDGCLQLDAFLFPQDTRNSICITCQLKATSEMQKSSLVNSNINSRWINVDGSDDVCRCCSSNFLTGHTNLGSLIPEGKL